MSKIVIACDSFKGSLTSVEASAAIREGILAACPQAQVVEIPVADGGEGTMEVLSRLIGAKPCSCAAHDALGREITAEYAMGEFDGAPTAIIDMATASGLTLLKKEERNPAVASTFGTGEMILDAWQRGCRNFIVGIGGSATNDAGKGMLEALGVRFLDRKGEPLASGGESLNDFAALDMSDARKDVLSASFTIICDVTNPLYGPNGAAYVFAPQKGADAAMVERLDKGLRRFALVVEVLTGKSISSLPGAGAAGGLGAAFAAFFRATLKRGIDTVLDIARFDEAVEGASLVITGEGKSDSQTLFGKVPMGVLRRAAGVPTVIISGSVEDVAELQKAGFAGVYASKPAAMPLEQAMLPEVAKNNLRSTASQVISSIKLC